MFGIESTEMIILFVVALLLFGKRLPEVARTVGKGVADFKKGLAGIDDHLRTSVHAPYQSASHSSGTSPAGPPPSRPAPLEHRESNESRGPAVPKFEPPRFEPGEGD
ncbi:MAG: twin-arginine translocase TatA/TatE family subunit [Planctomycetaceae bacterium]